MRILVLSLMLLFPFNLNNNVYKENPVIRQVIIEGCKGTYLLKGEIKSGHYYYIVEDGHIQYITEKRFKSSGKEWSSFRISIHLSQSKLPKNGSLILHLYQRDSRGSIINGYPVLLERFL